MPRPTEDLRHKLLELIPSPGSPRHQEFNEIAIEEQLNRDAELAGSIDLEATATFTSWLAVNEARGRPLAAAGHRSAGYLCC